MCLWLALSPSQCWLIDVVERAAQPNVRTVQENFDSLRTYGLHLDINAALAIGGVSMGGPRQSSFSKEDVL
jgi:hypothetical protein